MEYVGIVDKILYYHISRKSHIFMVNIIYNLEIY
jgi:hypothetical protein